MLGERISTTRSGGGLDAAIGDEVPPACAQQDKVGLHDGGVRKDEIHGGVEDEGEAGLLEGGHQGEKEPPGHGLMEGGGRQGRIELSFLQLVSSAVVREEAVLRVGERYPRCLNIRPVRS